MTMKNTTKFLQGIGTRIKRDLGQELYAALLIVSSSKGMLMLVLSALFGLIVYLAPFPPKTVYLMGAEMGTSYEIFGEKMKAALKDFDIELILLGRENKDEYAQEISDNPKNVMSLYVAGGAVPSGSRAHVSLGSVQYSPLWLFYRGKERSAESKWPEKLSIGPDGSSTQKIFMELQQLHEVKRNSDHYLRLDHEKATEALLVGEIDAMFLVDGYDSPMVQKLVHAPDIKVFSYDLADAYDKIIPHINKVVVPRGLFNASPVEPSKNLDILTTTATLLVDKQLHPVVQWAVLKSARDISLERKQIFADPGFFPVYLDRSFPISKIAAQFYQSGMPVLYGKISLWFSVLLDRVWFQLLALFAILLPIWALLPFARQYYFETVMQTAYLKLRDMDERIKKASSKEELQKILQDLKDLDTESGALWYSANNLRYYYVLKSTHIRNLALDVKTEIAKYE